MKLTLLHSASVVFTFFFLTLHLCMAEKGKPSIAELQQQAEQGDAEAQVNLGLKYRAGREVSQDYMVS
jgi:succinate dehydrogenase/fumarate reductase cytochrome b subunit